MSLNLARFKKPSRYIGNEINIIRKLGNVKVALCFPDMYEIGMSHLGLKILYSIINNIPYASAERVYAPWVDYEAYLRQNKLPLTSLEYQRPLMEFDIIGFTLQYELSYTNILNMLDLGGIPVRTDQRGDDYPLIIAGGPCAVNPLPLTPFIDAFIIGDGEEVIKEILALFLEGKRKENLLKDLSLLEGVYVPLVHDTNKQRVKRRIIKDLDKALFPEAPILPFASIVHDRIAIEISRGCTKGCRFCQAGMIYRPLRERSLENILSLSQRSILNTGYEEISFTSLSTGDYSNLLPLIRTFNKQCADFNVSISLPSLRVGSISSDVLKEIKSVRKTGFTIAPEAGTQRLRNIINKDFTEEEYDETLQKLFKEGWRNIKLYFMVGLPLETMDDINGLIDMAERALRRGREIAGKRININVGISAFVPKPHTPFQWIGQRPFKELREKQNYIRKAFKARGINFKGQYVEQSLLEAVFSRADKECALLIETAWRLGSCFDGWSELFNFDNWLLASEKTDIDIYNYASQTFDIGKELPWDLIDTGIEKRFLISEYQKSLRGEITSDCRCSCYGCGLECKEVSSQDVESRGDNVPFRESGISKNKSPANNRHLTTNPSRITRYASRTRMRVKFSKTGRMRYLSHHELMRSILRAIRRANLPIAYSAGFNPHPKISFGPALAVGVEGLNEYLDIELSTLIAPSDLLKKLNCVLPRGIEFLEAALISENERSLNDLISRYEYEIIIDKASEKRINSFVNKQRFLVSRENKTVDIRPLVEKVEIKDDILKLLLVDTETAKARLYEILREVLQKNTEDIQLSIIKRTGLYGYNSIKKLIQ